MAGLLLGDISQHGTNQGVSQRYSQEKPEDGSRWYFSRKEIEENSPSKLDGIDLKKETYLRKSYCTFLQDLGMRLKVPQVTIATAIIFCHRFFLRQSHVKNDRRTIATVCMFLAGKVEETPRPLKDVILVSYEIIHKKDPAAVQRIKQKEVYEQQKELILLGERVVLATLGFDLNVHHPYKPLVEAIKKFKVAQNALAQVAWNFVNDGLRTSLCLQFKPHHIAAGAIFLAAKFLKVKLPSDGEKVWWQEFDVTPRQLEEVSNQMLELYEQNRMPPSNDVEGTAGGGTFNRSTVKAPASNDETAATNSNSQTGATSSRLETSKPASSKSVFDSSVANHVGRPISNHVKSGDYGSIEMKHRVEDDAKGNQHTEWESLPYKESLHEAQDMVKARSDNGEKEHENNVGRIETKEPTELKDKHSSRNLDHRDSVFGRPPQEAIKKIDRDKVKAALEKRRKAAGHVTKKTDVMDDDDLIERELEDGIELGPQSEKNKQDKKQSWCKPSDRSDYDMHGRLPDHADEQLHGVKGSSSYEPDLSAVEEGEVSALDDFGAGLPSPKSSNRKRRAGNSPERGMEGKQRHNYGPGPHHNNRFDYVDDRNKVSRLGHPERDSKRHAQENHV
ncbi:cyclin-T1-3-like [Abrus precatorius]|uniref:B-like cyclin n=1 Tax=Abrus precatorius TaxID=3816 RepID=A0A8B8K8T4_ABRPR|nr:cyclin-T1-3-like [Abrus precatorius]XP_027340111.1 cyclin-T1-3-like [Abrus precatorius]XP_027340112.1 cyclin-T1-3-like [Abrus precatorius]